MFSSCHQIAITDRGTSQSTITCAIITLALRLYHGCSLSSRPRSIPTTSRRRRKNAAPCPLAPLTTAPQECSHCIAQSSQVEMPPDAISANVVRLEELGHGATGCVYKAVHATTLELLAVKEVTDNRHRSSSSAQTKP